MKNRFQKAVLIAWLFLLLINSGCSKKKYTYFFDQYQAPVKKDSVTVEQPPVFYASADTTSVAVTIEEKPKSIPTKIIVQHKKDSVLTPAQIKQKKRRPAAIIGFTSVVSSIPAAFLFFLITAVPWAILFFGGITLCIIGLKSDRKKLAKGGLWVGLGYVSVVILLILVAMVAGNLFLQK